MGKCDKHSDREACIAIEKAGQANTTVRGLLQGTSGGARVMADIQATPEITWFCWYCSYSLDNDKKAKSWSCGNCGKWNGIPELMVREEVKSEAQNG